MTTNPRRSLVPGIQFATSAIEGFVLSTVVLHATLALGIAPTAIGVVLAGAAGAAMISAVPLGALIDRLGVGRAAALLALISALGLVGCACAESLPGLAAAAVVFGIGQSMSAAARQALAVAHISPEDRLTIRATMHMLLNAGIGVGTAIGAAAVAFGPGAATRIGYGAGAAALVVTALMLRGEDRRQSQTARRRGGEPRPDRPRTVERPGIMVALRDRRFATALVLATVVQLTMPVLSVILPVWVVIHTGAPIWLAAVVLTVNTSLVIVGQRRWASRLTTVSSTVRTAVAAAAALGTAAVLFAVSDALPTPGAFSAAVVTGAVALTIGEVGAGLAIWRVALDEVPAAAEGRYQAAYSMSTSAARIIGPACVLPLILAFGGIAWVEVGAALSAGALGIAWLAGRPLSSVPTSRRSTRQG